MSECYAIVNQDYDSTVIAGVYESREDADAMLAAVRAYCTDNEWPSSPRTDASDAAFNKWERALKKWNKKHPLGPELAYHKDDFNVWPLPFHHANPTRPAQ